VHQRFPYLVDGHLGRIVFMNCKFSFSHNDTSVDEALPDCFSHRMADRTALHVDDSLESILSVRRGGHSKGMREDE